MTRDQPPPIDVLPHAETAMFRAYHRLVFLTSHLSLTLGWSLRIQGQRFMPQTGPALVVANHQSFLDPLLVGVSTYRPLVYLARKTLFKNRFLAAIIRSLNAVPIDQEGVGKEGIRTILEQLQLGRAVLVFPEGSRTPDGPMHPFKPGIHLLIKRAKAPIVPVGIAGAYDAWPIWRKYPIPAPLCLPCRKGAISVSLGRPIEPGRFTSMPREQALKELFDRIHDEQQRAEKLRRRA